MSSLEASELERLVDSWWRRPEWRLRHLARNLVLDCHGLDQPVHPDLETCGRRLDEEAERRLDELAGELAPRLAEIEARNASWDDTWSAIRRALEVAGQRFRDRSPSPPAASGRQSQLVRYLDCRAVYEHWLYPGPGLDPGATHPREIRRGIEAIFRRADDRVAADSLAPAASAASIMLTAPGRVVWVTADDPAPHRRPALADLEPPDRALAIFRLIALPGYDGVEDRREKVGLIAATYTFDARGLRVPTVLQALDNPYFFPGYRLDDHGRVASLDDDSRCPWQRDASNSTIVEWVHENASLLTAQPELELVGYFDE